MGFIRDSLEVAADSPIAIALDLTNNVIPGGKFVYYVGVATFTSLSKMYTDSNGERKYTCGICGSPGHNRRTCDKKLTCGNCGNQEPDELWEYEGATVCNKCV